MPKPYLLVCTLATVVLLSSCTKNYESVNDTSFDSLLENLDPNAESVFMQNALQDPKMNNRQWQGIPSIGATKDSKQIYVAWYSGGKNEGAGNYVTVALSLDKGRDWLNDKLVVYPADTLLLRFFDPSVWRDKNDNIWLTWTKSHNFWDGKGGVWTSRIRWNGKVIEHNDVKELSDGVMMNKPIYVSRGNCVLFPISVWNISPTQPFNQGVFIYKGEYGTASLKVDSLKLLSRIYVDDNIRTYDEHQVVELNLRGKMMCMVRTRVGIYYALSLDYGESWGALKPFMAVGPTPSSRFHLSRLRSGKILLIANNSTDRSKLTAFLSSDEGNTFPKKLVIDKRSDISYPDAIQTDDNFIHLVYDRGRTTEKQILYCKFREADILSSSSANILRRQVNCH